MWTFKAILGGILRKTWLIRYSIMKGRERQRERESEKERDEGGI